MYKEICFCWRLMLKGNLFINLLPINKHVGAKKVSTFPFSAVAASINPEKGFYVGEKKIKT